jgi:hypothetical protein
MDIKTKTTLQPKPSQLDELKLELEQTNKDLAQCVEAMKKLNERVEELRAKIKVATDSESLKTEKPKQQELTITNMTIGSLESVFRDSPLYLDFRQLRRLAKGKNIIIKGKTKEAYISQIKAALDD